MNDNNAKAVRMRNRVIVAAIGYMLALATLVGFGLSGLGVARAVTR